MIRLFIGFMFLVCASQVQAKQEINILFLGKTQTGKSSLVNIFYNHIIGKRCEDERAIVIPLLDGVDELLVNVEEYKAYDVKLRGMNQSQTSKVLRYTAENDRYIVHLWDAPGFNDTTQEVTDEEVAERIASAVHGTHFHAIAIVLKPNEPPSFDMKANIDRIKTIVPKSALGNIVGIYTRAGNLSKGVREAGVQAFHDMFDISPSILEPNVYFIDGTSFFDKDAYDSIGRWRKDKHAVEGMLHEMAQLNPFDASEITASQNTLKIADAKFRERTAGLEQLKRLKVKQLHATNEVNAAQKSRDENKHHKKKGPPPRRRNYRVGPKIQNWNWRYRRFGVADFEVRMDWITDDAKMQRYTSALKELRRSQQDLKNLVLEEQVLQEKLSCLNNDLQKLKSSWASRAISIQVDSFLVYLERKISFVQKSASYDETYRSNKIAALSAKKSFYEFLRDL